MKPLLVNELILAGKPIAGHRPRGWRYQDWHRVSTGATSRGDVYISRILKSLFLVVVRRVVNEVRMGEAGET